jgi:hypothetical protein
VVAGKVPMTSVTKRRVAWAPLVVGAGALLLGSLGWLFWHVRFRMYLSTCGLASDPKCLEGFLLKGRLSLLAGVGAAVTGSILTLVLRHALLREEV